jgi:hypothetical protein
MAIKDSYYQVRLDKGTLRAWKAAARAAGVTLAELIRSAVSERIGAR